MSKLKSIFVAQLVLAAALTPMRGPAQDWGYDGAAGPSFWGGLDPSYAACGDGTSQSPIDLESRDTTEQSNADYLPTRGKIDSRLGKLELINGFPIDATVEKLCAAIDFQRACQHTFGPCRTWAW